MQPVVSIVIPTYQRCNRLKKALKSVLSQTYKDYEVLIVDDGSYDGTKEMVMNLNDSRISYNWQNNSGGPAKPRNEGIKTAKGEWIAFLDSDDWWLPGKLKNCLSKINDDIDLIYHDLIVERNHKTFFKGKKLKSRQLKKPILKDLLLNGNVISNSSVIVRKKLLVEAGYIDEREALIAVEDYHIWLKIAKLTDRFLHVPESLGYYLENNEGISKKDMSVPSKNAVREFQKYLNNKENLILEANLKYKKGKFEYEKKNFKKAKENLLFVIRNGRNSLKLRSLFIILMIFFR
tara:strand:+ start:1444 stop:2316 length:873 start_codon:yes stop_codon:yes gene_type:complete